MEARFKAFGVDISAEANRIRVGAHFNGRTVEAKASHWPAREDENGPREAYISVSLEGEKESYELTDEDRRKGYALRVSDVTSYLDIEQARALRDRLSEALDCADVK